MLRFLDKRDQKTSVKGISALLIGMCAFYGHTSGIDDLGLSLGDLANLRVTTGTITEMKASHIPVSVTTITAQDIELTPARNIYDLIETYVPGALWMNHHEGPKLGMRGIITDRNYKFLVVVDGRNLNQKAHNGATSELENWDLSDIEKIEVIRGPGSVTYGPGAVMGVVNITTKSARDQDGLSLSTQYVTKYHSMGTSAAFGQTKDNVSLYAYASMVRTPGHEPEAFTVASINNYGYVGKDFGNPPLTYFSDFDGEPQRKGYLEMAVKDVTEEVKDVKFSVRYTEAGMSANGVNQKTRYQTGAMPGEIKLDTLEDGTTQYTQSYTPIFGPFVNHKQLKNRHLTAALDATVVLPVLEGLTLKPMLMWDTEDHIRNQTFLRRYDNLTDPRMWDLSNPETIKNRVFSFSESEFMGRLTGILRLTENHQVALGIEGSINTWGAPWGKDAQYLRMGDRQNIISDDNSPALGTGALASVRPEEAIFVDEGWSTWSGASFVEGNFVFNPITILLSARLDKDKFSKYLLSPRAAVVYEATENDIIKVIAQISNRMNTAEALYVENHMGIESDPEQLAGFEGIYLRNWSENVSTHFSGFYNTVDILSFQLTNYRDGRWHGETERTGTLKLGGLEAEARYQNDIVTVGANHAFTKQLSWELNEGNTHTGISYGDYRRPVAGGDTLKSVGNDLNNWANHATKAFVRLNVFDRLALHVDSRIFWSFDGAKDGLEMLKRDATPSEELTSILDRLDEVGVYDMDFRLNVSAVTRLSDNIRTTVYVQNLLGSNDNKRYSYDAGIGSPFPHRVAFVEEPRTVGVRVDLDF